MSRPSALHPRDMQRVISVMKKLRDAGNSLIVVEHDPQIMLEADRILDIGPAPASAAGHIVFFGTPEEIRATGTSLTGEYLSGRKKVGARPPKEKSRPGASLTQRLPARSSRKPFPTDGWSCTAPASTT